MMSNTPFEITKLYKEETADVPTLWSVSARIGRHGDIIIDQLDCPEILMHEVDRSGEIDMPDPEYINWIEEKVLKMIKDGYK